MPNPREQWFAVLVQAGLDTRVLAETDVLAHATPTVLITALPKDVLVKVFDSALGAGTISPKAVLAHVTPAVLSAHVQHDVLWGCLAAGAGRAHLVADGDKDKATDDGREFLRLALDSGLATGVLTPADILAKVDAKVLVHALPDALTTKLLEATLAAGVMNPQIVVDTVGTAAIAKWVPPHIVWAVVAKAGEAKGGEVQVPVAKPALEVVEDSPEPSIVVEIDEQPRGAMPPAPPSKTTPPPVKPAPPTAKIPEKRS